MDVVWSATEPGSRCFRPAPVRSDLAELDDHFRRLRRRRVRGYIEVEVPDVESPRLTIGFRGEYAVVHLLVAAPVARSFVLAGDGSVPKEAYVELPVVDELARFNGDVVLGVHRAWDLVRSFVRTGRAGELGKWHALEARQGQLSKKRFVSYDCLDSGSLADGKVHRHPSTVEWTDDMSVRLARGTSALDLVSYLRAADDKGRAGVTSWRF